MEPNSKLTLADCLEAIGAAFIIFAFFALAVFA
jgi:hypothetical protein